MKKKEEAFNPLELGTYSGGTTCGCWDWTWILYKRSKHNWTICLTPTESWVIIWNMIVFTLWNSLFCLSIAPMLLHDYTLNKPQVFMWGWCQSLMGNASCSVMPVSSNILSMVLLLIFLSWAVNYTLPSVYETADRYSNNEGDIKHLAVQVFTFLTQLSLLSTELFS